MQILATVAAIVVAVLHVGFFALETFLWTKPQGRKIFGTSEEEADQTKVLAANQGVYNACVAAAIIAFVAAGNGPALQIMLLFVVVVGVYGANTASPRVLWVQAAPAAIAIALNSLA